LSLSPLLAAPTHAAIIYDAGCVAYNSSGGCSVYQWMSYNTSTCEMHVLQNGPGVAKIAIEAGMNEWSEWLC
jgi:hypothetical protein